MKYPPPLEILELAENIGIIAPDKARTMDIVRLEKFYRHAFKDGMHYERNMCADLCVSVGSRGSADAYFDAADKCAEEIKQRMD